jgi:UDP-N-acetylmuramate--alanine ligase
MKIHFIGIGGIGMSALAQYYLSKGHEISGSDLTMTEITDFLRERGIVFFVPENPDLVIYSPAVKKSNPELKKFLDAGIKCQSYPEALGKITKDYYTIAVAGAHGKSTTTAMIGILMQKAGLDPTVIVGTKVKEFGNNNFRFGKSKFLVIEACEYDSSFLNYYPEIIVVTNIDKEHLDYFKTFANVKKAFRDFILKLPETGFLVFNKDDEKNSKFKIQSSKILFKIKNYSLSQKEAKKIQNILKIPGQHNVSNALAVLQVARILGVPDKISFKSLSEFKGTWRRFEEKSEIIEEKKITVISDYAHHPNEIKATLQSAREKYPNKTIWCVFQPHQYQRTFYLFDDFVKIFRLAPVNKIIITDIYDVAGRETKDIKNEVDSKKLVEKINRKNVRYISIACPSEASGEGGCDIEKLVKENVKAGDVLIIMGAGDIYKLADKF